MFVLTYLFVGGEAPHCLASANVNGEGDVNIADPVYLLQFLFSGGAGPPEPFPACGPSSLDDDVALGCITPHC